MPSAVTIGSGSGSWRLGVAALAGHLLVLALLYGPARHLGLISDAWAILGVVPEGPLQAFRTTIGYHYIPVASLLVQAGRTAFGVRDAPWQLANLLQFALVAHLVFQVGRRLMPWWLAFLGSLLFMANSSFHEVTHWSLVGNIHSLGVTFYLLGMLLVLDLRDRAPTVVRSVLLALCAALGTFTYEGMISLVPAAAVILALGIEWPGDASWRQRLAVAWRRVARPLLPCGVVVVLLVLAKMRFSAQLATAVSFGVDSIRLVFLARGTAGLFTLRAPETVLHRMITLGWQRPDLAGLFAKGWALAGAAVIAFVFVRFRRSVPALLLGWLAVHLALTGVSLTMVSRHNYLPAVPAALLSAWLLGAIARSASRRFHRGEPHAPLTVLLASLGALTLVASGARDLRRTREVWGQSSRAHRDVAEAVSTLVPTRIAPVTLCFVNMPAVRTDGGISVYVFRNGLTDVGRFHGGGRVGPIEFAYARDISPLREFADTSRPVSLEQIQAWVESDDHLVIAFDDVDQRVRVLTTERPLRASFAGWSFRPQARYDAAGAHLLRPTSDDPTPLVIEDPFVLAMNTVRAEPMPAARGVQP